MYKVKYINKTFKEKLKIYKQFFSKEYKPYVIGKIFEDKNKVKLNGSINWLQ